MSKSVKIVIDADVVIHFMKGETLHLLPRIFPAYKYYHHGFYLAGIYYEIDK
jgi:hypothetical protein